MVELENNSSLPSDPPQPPSTSIRQPQTGFNPSRMIGIIRRKAMIKDLAAMYHAECLAYCQELLELQNKVEESLIDMKPAEDSRRETMRPPKRMKKAR
ncbi:uncharacterized protein LOC132609154 [Lycium barbarum]|uniref:uncharacterized protein LOC132609154 n=1 Tax=Lycium barbarum TaxID=112863 RepID=UPI00293EEECD|nr:uncharacterized protein LOC132609154 [Lycium barbarum]